jgi:hypothetical protein
LRFALRRRRKRLCTDVRGFQGIADIENNTAKELTKLGAVIQVPFKAGNQFLGEDGLQVSVPHV